MDRKQADAVAQAILDPLVKSQQELRQKRENKDALRSARLAVQRRVAVCALVGMAVGAGIGHFVYGRPEQGFFIGGIVAFLLAQLVVVMRSIFSSRQTSDARRSD